MQMNMKVTLSLILFYWERAIHMQVAADCKISNESIKQIRNEFSYFYPVDATTFWKRLDSKSFVIFYF